MAVHKMWNSTTQPQPQQYNSRRRVYHHPLYSRKSSRIVTLALFLVIVTIFIVPSSSSTTTTVPTTAFSIRTSSRRLGGVLWKNHQHYPPPHLPHTYSYPSTTDNNNILGKVKSSSFSSSSSSSTALGMASLTAASSTSSSATRLSSVVAPLQYIHHDDDDNDDDANANHNDETTTTTTATTPAGGSVIRAIAISQILTLCVTTVLTCGLLLVGHGNPDPMTWHWNYDPSSSSMMNAAAGGGGTYHSLLEGMSTSSGVSYESILEGVVATIPMIYMGTIIEQSSERDESHVNFSTMNMVMTLFGRRRRQQPPPQPQQEDRMTMASPPTATTSSSSSSMIQVLPVAAGIALMTGLSEELVFRGEIPTVLNQWLLLSSSSSSSIVSSSSSSMDTLAIFLTVWIGQATLFGLGHVTSKASWGENRIVSGLQFINGLWYGAVYTMTGGNILPCMIAHFLYDCHVFMETWMSMNDQMDYTDHACSQPLSLQDKHAMAQIQKEAGPMLTSQTLDYTRRFFYTFDYEHKGSLSRSDVQRAVSYAFLQDDVQPSMERVDKLFEGMLKRRAKESLSKGREIRMSMPSPPPHFPRDRLRLSDFLRVLFVLKGNPT